MITFVVLSFIGLKAYAAAQANGVTQSMMAEQDSSAAATTTAGISAGNGMPASPSPNGALTTANVPLAYNDDGEDDDGAMSATVAATMASQSPEPKIMPMPELYDSNETQSTSGQDNPTSHAYRVQGYPRNHKSSAMDRIWADACDTDYISSQPEIQYRFHAPGVQRQDWNPEYNNQPWARNESFKNYNDPTSQFDTDANGIPSSSNWFDDDEEGV